MKPGRPQQCKTLRLRLALVLRPALQAGQVVLALLLPGWKKRTSSLYLNAGFCGFLGEELLIALRTK
jgi:hypothetical protein